MDTVFSYATSQLLGMQFEAFSYSFAGQHFDWNPPGIIKGLCRALLPVSSGLTRLIFSVFVKVS